MPHSIKITKSGAWETGKCLLSSPPSSHINSQTWWLIPAIPGETETGRCLELTGQPPQLTQ